MSFKVETDRRTNLDFHTALYDFDLGLAKSSSILRTHFSSQFKIGRVVTSLQDMETELDYNLKLSSVVNLTIGSPSFSPVHN